MFFAANARDTGVGPKAKALGLLDNALQINLTPTPGIVNFKMNADFFMLAIFSPKSAKTPNVEQSSLLTQN